MMYFILGTHPELSTAELQAVLGGQYAPIATSPMVVVNQTIEKNLGVLQDRLAGIVKIGRVVGELKEWNPGAAVNLMASLASEVAGDGRISFGLSVYDVGNATMTRRLERELDSIGIEIKKQLKQTGRPVRYVKGREPRLSSVIVKTNGLLSSGSEFVLLANEKSVWIGQTECVQDFKAWSKRDFGRPARDPRSGMLPPKLARIMINLGRIDPIGASILDPFCGSGTVLMEAALMGFEKLIGSDIKEEAIKDTARNITWLVDRFALAPPKLSLYTTAAANLPSMCSTSVDLIVTEVCLGEPRALRIDNQEARRTEEKLLPIYTSSFRALQTLLKPRSRLVVAFPAFKKEDGAWHRLPLTSHLQALGYSIIATHFYSRPDQYVARDIYVFTKK